jgi:transcriptional enhancer factor
MIVDGVGQPVHCLAEVHSNSRLDSSDIVDLASWRHEYPEFNFLRSKTEDWMSSSWKGLVCTASIDVMTKVRLNADLTIALGLYSQLDLSRYDYLECMTRFYDNGKSAFDPAFDSTNRDQKEQRTSCEYQPDPHESKGVLRIRFDAAFWVARMEKFQNMTHRDERSFRDLLQRLTAVQDIYGILPGTDKAQCLCTVLWRFQQTEHSAEVGGMKWRSISFAMCRSAVEEGWRHDAEDKINDPGNTNVHHEKVLNLPKSTPKDMTPYHQASQLPVDLAQTHVSHHSYAIGSHHERHPPSLSIDILKSIQPDSDHFDGSAATTTTDFSQQSLALPRNQGTLASNAHGNDFDFNGSHINTGGVFEPALNISGYGDFSSQSARFEGLHSLAGLEHDEFAAMGLAIGEYGQLVPVNANDLHDSSEQACDSTKPNWQHAHLISHLENAAEQYHSYLGANDHLQSTQNHGDSHGHDDYQQINPMEESVAIDLHDVDAHTNHSLWGLQELQGPFEERSASGAISGICCRKEQAHGSEFGAPDLVEGIQRGRGYQT